MPLLDVRQKFIESTGRYDLVTDITSWADNGADWFIRAGQRYLDRELEIGRHKARYFTKLLPNHHSIHIPYARVIEKVYRLEVDSRTRLEEATIGTLIEWFDEDTEELILGAPQCYAPLLTKIAPDSDLSYVSGVFANASYESDAHAGLFFGVKADTTYGIEVEGLFYSPSLTLDTDKSYWTEEHPEILVASAFLSLERFYRNFEGVKECKAVVDDLVRQLNFDAVAQEIVNIVRMEG